VLNKKDVTFFNNIRIENNYKLGMHLKIDLGSVPYIAICQESTYDI
jgi:hypothetical protein